ncbi:BlaI/MecI/CopY family transcriptional regulator [Parasphingorhabdus sp. DH2-15]|uniref:BlaI/MecI/CopY family transcriptional regulator n=1 Tax=Parasphingorhabdus sp. DH2-15 TaxID=3444112 RepID=UPI003F683C76
MQTERISDAEFEVMNCLWQTSPLTAADIAGLVPQERQWSLQTVKTLLSRLVAKNVINHEVDGRRYLYSPLVSRSEYVSGESKRFVDRLFSGRAGPLFAHLAEREAFSEEDISDIEKLLREMKK